MIQAGIDEAGYGPVLGPLVTAMAVFETESDKIEDLWVGLQKLVRKEVRGNDEQRLTVADSKNLYHAGDGIGALETVALAFCGAFSGGHIPRHGAEFLAQRGLCSPPCADYPWYACGLESLTLPLSGQIERIQTFAAKLADAMEEAGLRPLLLLTHPLLEAEFSARAEHFDSKARALFDCNVDLIQTLRSTPSPEATRVLCDRHGSRRHYGALLEQAFPLAGVEVLHERKASSAYHIGEGHTGFEVQYVTSGESHGMEVALASIMAKYTRELFMTCFNAHFSKRAPGLKPTAGYYVDGMRFVEDLDRARILKKGERERLIRSR